MKPDAELFKTFLDELPKKERLGKQRSPWVKFAFHFTDIINAIAILTTGKVRCRADLELENLLSVDIASPTVLATTSAEVKKSVRLYFRPRTPTQHQMEGIRPDGNLWNESHCPVPVFFLFDLLTILTKDDCSFSDGNLAALGPKRLYSTARELATLDFQKIYHVDWLSAENKRDIILHRNAEIVIPKELDLDSLKFIYCRTPAEKETLLHKLPWEVKSEWGSRIIVASSTSLFYRHWVFIDTVILDHKSATLNFSPDPQKSGPFELRLVRRAEETQERTISNFKAAGKVQVDFEANIWMYEIEVYLSGHLAFAGAYDGRDEIPF